jgi:hypothetical protein
MKRRKKLRISRIIGAAILLAICILAAFLIFHDFGETQPEQSEGVLLDIMTGEVSDYSLSLLRIDGIENNSVRNWARDIVNSERFRSNEGYYTLYNNSSEAMDMYLLSPVVNRIGDIIGISNVKVTESGTALIISIDTDGEIGDTEDTDLVLHIFTVNPENTQAKSDLLIVNGRAYTYVSSTFMELGQ